MAHPVKCTICIDSLDPKTPLFPVTHADEKEEESTQHLFHQSCADTWFKEFKTSCPNCNRKVTHFNKRRLVPLLPKEPSYFLQTALENDSTQVTLFLGGNISQEDLKLALLLTASKGHRATLEVLLKKPFSIEDLEAARELANQNRYFRSANLLKDKIKVTQKALASKK